MMTTTPPTHPPRKGLKSGVTNELSCFFKVIPGRAPAIRQASHAADGNPQRLEAFTKLGILTEARVVLFDNDTRLGFFTVYEGDWDFYIEAFMPDVIPALDRVFRGNIEGYPTQPLAQITVDDAKAFLNAHQVTAVGFVWIHGDETLKDIWRAEAVQKAFQQVLDTPGAAQALANPVLKPLLDLASS
jgi:hypothetical protein